MQYDYQCTNEGCMNVQEESHSVNGFKEFTPKCIQCGSDCKYTFTPSVPYVNWKDGPSGSWTGKGDRFKKHRAEQSAKMEKRQFERYGDVSKGAIPNYNGKEASSWAEVQAEARRDRGKESAATYNAKVSEEKARVEKTGTKV